jgi:three-Cys-motif partner protein
MKGDKWSGKINYIEICCGPGICIDRESQAEFLGTSLAIANKPSFNNLNKAIFVDYDPAVVDILNKRLVYYGKAPKALAIQGDYNYPEDLVTKIRPYIQSKGLNLIFIDPTDLSVPLQSVIKLSEEFGKADLIINIMYGTDAKRGIGYALNKPTGKARKKYSRFLGSSDFFEDEANKYLWETKNHDQLHRKFVEYYLNKLNRIGYIYTGHQAIENVYELFFASKHHLALKFWNDTIAKEQCGQRKLF